ncbi:hypothetical protein [Mycolicibacterium tokaiense]|uniref:Putative phiRv1 phage protein n=1 Tax=Mycolicibacterium tokaiense TaxID=39695 RepID=A0A378TE18_9MYCO|nr:hypothetical protein [Mycolicibacterium tokaiense]BBY86506.1 hypothetical protein MTOK_22880 [Mycolicibacterium tokaiense]STZ58989.1 putative phiRv1 phage protein [Mycolicibacterium tokaiense]
MSAAAADREAAIDAYVAEILAGAPPLSEDRRAKLAELLRPVRIRPERQASGDAA